MEFNEYIENCKQAIKNARPNATQQAIDWNAPFILEPEQPTQKGILLIHGLLDSCFAMKDLAKAFQVKGYLVFAILLPGHGTQPIDLCDVRVEDWLKIIDYGVKSLKKRVNHISLAGHSTGASLALEYTAQQPKHTIEKIYGFAPACGLKAKLACLTGIITKIAK